MDCIIRAVPYETLLYLITVPKVYLVSFTGFHTSYLGDDRRWVYPQYMPRHHSYDAPTYGFCCHSFPHNNRTICRSLCFAIASLPDRSPKGDETIYPRLPMLGRDSRSEFHSARLAPHPSGRSPHIRKPSAARHNDDASICA